MHLFHPFPRLGQTLLSSCLAFSLCSLAGCSGGVLKFTAGANASVKVQENTLGKVWHASVTIEGPGSIYGLNYKLGGPDQDKFLINTTTGELAWREAVDFEQPEDADQNNEYQVNIEASANNQTAAQSLYIHLEDVSIPQVELVKPKLNENLAQKTDVQVNAVVRLYDAESNQPLDSAAAFVNGQSLQQDVNNPQLFNGVVTVPAAGLDISLAGQYARAQSVRAQGKLFNKELAVSPVNFGVVPGSYLFYLDDTDSAVSKLNLQTGISAHYVQHSLFPDSAPIFDFNSSHQAVYTTLTESLGRTQLYGFLVGRSAPEYFRAGSTQDQILNITYDSLNKRVLLVSRDSQQPGADYKVLALATDEKTAFVNAATCNSCQQELEENIVWRITTDIIKGTFKQLAFHRISGTFVVADERKQAGRLVTVLQGFSEAGEKRFESVVGPDISNITINNPKGIIYVAENHSSVAGRIKAIDVATGITTDLLTSVGNNFIGAYSEIRIDNTNQLLYIADSVSDDFFVVDLATNTMKSLEAKRIQYFFAE